MDSPLWTPSPDRVAGTRMTAFMQAVTSRFDFAIADYTALYDFSVSRPEDFWRLMWDFAGVRGTMDCVLSLIWIGCPARGSFPTPR